MNMVENVIVLLVHLEVRIPRENLIANAMCVHINSDLGHRRLWS